MTFTLTLQFTIPAAAVSLTNELLATLLFAYTAILSALFGETEVQTLDIAGITPWDTAVTPIPAGVYQVYCNGYSYIAHLSESQATNLYSFGHVVAYCV
jgi:hypothetical protein